MMGRIAGFVLRMLPVMAAAVPLVAAARLAGARRLKKRGLTTTLRHEAGLWAFLLFLAGLAAVTILPPGGQFIPPSWSRVNLRPLVVLADSLAAMRAGDGMYFVINVLGNILMFLPLGFFHCLLWGRGKTASSVAPAPPFRPPSVWSSASCSSPAPPTWMTSGSTPWGAPWATGYIRPSAGCGRGGRMGGG